jgi:iron complex outermembrane recepter protein
MQTKIWFLMGGAWVAFAGPAYAEEAETEDDKTIIVTATRAEQLASDAPAAVTVVTSEEIDNRNVSRISDALLKTPSLYLGRGENGQSQSFEGGFSLRGLSTTRTLILLDGLQPVQNGNSQGVNWLTVFNEDVERVEVVPGAFGALYGSNAIGGVINVITKRPSERELTVRLRKGFGDASGENPSIYFRDRIWRGLGIVAGISYNNRDGYVNEITVRTPVAGAPGTPVNGAIPTTTREGLPAFIVGDRGKQPWQQINALVKAEYEFNADQRIHAGYAYAKAETGFKPFNTYLTNAATGAPVSNGTLGINGQRVTLAESNFVASSPLLESSNRVFGGYEGVFGEDIRLKIDVSHISRQFSFPTIGTGATAGSGPGTLSSSPNKSLDAAATISFPLGSMNDVIIGASYHRDTVNRRTFVLTNWRDPSTRTNVTNGYNGRSTTSSVFIQDSFTPFDALTIYAGARLDRWTTEGDFFQLIAPVSAIAYPKRSETSFNPKLSAVFRATDQLTLRAAWGESFRNPSNLDLYSTTVQSSTISPTGLLTIQSDPSLKPERGKSWEAGAEWRVGEFARLTGTVYETRLTDLIYSQQVSLALTQRINAGRARIRGFEAGVTLKPTDWLELVTNLSYIDSELLENNTDPLSVGKRLTQVPEWLGYIGLTANKGPVNATVETRYSGQTFITARNTDIVQNVPTANDSYWMTNAKIGYRFGPMIRANLSVNNVFDEKVYQFSLLPGRNATVELVLSF